MRALALILLLAACASPAMGYRDAPRKDYVLQGIHLSVFRKGDEVEVIRTGWVPRSQRDRIPALMMKAAEMATGCRALPGSLVHQLPGDTAEGRLKIAC